MPPNVKSSALLDVGPDTASAWIRDRGSVFDVPCTACSTDGHCAGSLMKPSAFSNKNTTKSHQEQVAIRFKFKLTDTLTGYWETVYIRHNRTLYVKIPPSSDGEGTKSSFIRLLEYAEKMLCENVVVFFQENRQDKACWIRAFSFLGFVLLPPKDPLRPASSSGFIYMNYRID